jgi:vancomycin permeability regulator SanA
MADLTEQPESGAAVERDPTGDCDAGAADGPTAEPGPAGEPGPTAESGRGGEAESGRGGEVESGRGGEPAREADRAAAEPGPAGRARAAWRRWRRPVLILLVVGAVLTGTLVTGTVTWTRERSAGRVHPVGRAPAAPVAIVFGTELAPGGTEPMPFLAARLDATARLYAAGRVRAILVSGDGAGDSGDEVTAMRAYLIRRGVSARRIAADPYGLDTYDTCLRGRETYGIRRALLVTQPYHLPRAVTLCRSVGVDAHGVKAPCLSCWWPSRAWRVAREAFATVKAAGDAARRRRPAVVTPPDPSLRRALRG